jgi:RNA-directed DNA polymerase
LEYKKCYLYGLKSKHKLMKLLYIKRRVYFKSTFISCKIFPYIENGEKSRLIEAPDNDIKIIQKNILHFLQRLDIPQYVYSGIKGKCYINNAREHGNKKYLYKMDISKFFPNINRDKVYSFYINKLKTSPDVGEILTNLTTINLKLKNKYTKTMKQVNNFILEKNIKYDNHLITGSPLSCIMSYLVNEDMFTYIYNIARTYFITMTIYVDDLIFSSNKKIPLIFKKKILNIINNNNYLISKNKCKSYNRPLPKKVTGVILNKEGNIEIPNGLMHKTHNYIMEIRHKNYENIDKLQGCVSVINSINGKLSIIKNELKYIKKKKYII